MEIKLLKLKLKNFKGIKDLEIDFKGNNTNIYGENATGKTTIFDAFRWLLFDKDSNNKKDFNIKTLDNNNKPIHFLEHEVEATMEIDGVTTILKKMLQEKWVIKRGQSNQEFSGHETKYWIDEVPIKKKEYEEKINEIILENLFKLITNPLYFNNLDWQEKREILLKISNISVEDENILKSKEEFKILIDKLQGRSIEAYKKIIYAKIKDLKEEKEKLPIRIDELNTTLLNTSVETDYSKLKKVKITANNRIEQINNILLDTQKRAEENNKLVDRLSAKKFQLSDLQNRLENEEKTKIFNKKVNLENKMHELQNNLNNTTTNINNFIDKIKIFEKERVDLRSKLDELKKKTFKLDQTAEFICPTCKQLLPAEEKEKQIQQLQENFIKHKKEEIESINKQGLNAKNSQEQYEKWLEEHQKKVETIHTKIINIKGELLTLDEEIKIAQTQQTFITVDSVEFKALCEDLKNLEEKVQNLKSEKLNQVLVDEKKNIETDVAEINEILAKRDIEEKTRARINELSEQETVMAQQIQDMEQQQYLIEEFTKAKVNLVTEAINSKFSIVKFRLFNIQINGGIVECCDTLVGGVPYQDVNNAHKIIAGLDIINTLMNYYDVSAPIFIDNAESIVAKYEIDAQVIRLVVSNNKVLKIEVT